MLFISLEELNSKLFFPPNLKTLCNHSYLNNFSCTVQLEYLLVQEKLTYLDLVHGF